MLLIYLRQAKALVPITLFVVVQLAPPLEKVETLKLGADEIDISNTETGDIELKDGSEAKIGGSKRK